MLNQDCVPCYYPIEGQVKLTYSFNRITIVFKKNSITTHQFHVSSLYKHDKDRLDG